MTLTFDDFVMKKVNEENACNAFIEILEKITGVEYEKEDSPDEHSGASSDVDYILISKDGRSHRIAVEHTIVESFEKQIAYVNQSYDVVEQINVQCQGKLPANRYYILTVPHPLIKSLKRKRKKRFVEDMYLWVSDIAKTLTTDQWSSQTYNNQEVTLICGGSHPEMNGNVGRIPEQPQDSDKLKRERFRRAIKDKLPKLKKYKRKGITTSLLLEDIGGILLDLRRRRRDLKITQRFWISKSVDYVIILRSNNQRMVSCNVWKEKRHWYSTIPRDRRFRLHR